MKRLELMCALDLAYHLVASTGTTTMEAYHFCYVIKTHLKKWVVVDEINGLVQDCSNSIASTLESCTKPLKYAGIPFSNELQLLD